MKANTKVERPTSVDQYRMGSGIPMSLFHLLASAMLTKLENESINEAIAKSIFGSAPLTI